MKRFLLLLIRLYQKTFGLFLGKSCRFYPSCSEYAKEAIEKKGVKGIFFIARRILKCGPWHAGGYDPFDY